jgi:antitoxin HicB
VATNTATRIEKEVNRIVALSYTREVVPNSDGTWFARIVEFPGCMSEGDTQGEALEMLEGAMRGWITVHLEDNDPIPEPINVEGYSGKFMVRVSKSLHRDLARCADIQGVSLNLFVNTHLALVVGAKCNDRTQGNSQNSKVKN